jgi:hypothetical protein
MYRRFEIDITLNGLRFRELWIDPHYEEKHRASINDLLIIDLIEGINKMTFDCQAKVNGFEFYEVDVHFREKRYRLVLVLPPDKAYLGVRNAYRRSNERT